MVVHLTLSACNAEIACIKMPTGAHSIAMSEINEVNNKLTHIPEFAVPRSYAAWPDRRGLAMAGSLLGIALIICLLAAAHYHFRPAANAVSAMASGNYRAAVKLYTEAAANGDRRASNSLGNLYYLGLGVELDYTMAAKHYLESASAGVADAQLNIANLFKLGLGVTHDPMRAFAWYNMADIHGNPAAEFYMKQISQEWTLSPLQISTALEKWSRLPALVAEGL